ncbi:hypothetical protein ACFYTQ_31910 [Nocardia sp. NPDC004068]|uniref:hypothetical protein n=1 Tax=Nocardia sp. NPDC004068 TaxID=3364303 RepID=UPI0036A1EBA4
MTTPVQQPPETEQPWGAPQPAPSGWTTRKSLAAVGVAAVIAAAGAGVVYAASGHSTESRGPGGGPGMSMNGPGGQSARGGGMIMPGALHGEFVVSDGNGGYATELTQTGTVTAVSADSITAKSADDYSHTYAITSNTTGATAKVGDTVTIRATESNNTATATEITTGTASQGRGMQGQGRGQFPGGPNQSGGTGQFPGAPGQLPPQPGGPTP